MFRLIVILTLFSAVCVYANPAVLKPGATGDEAPSPEQVVEGVGTVAYATVPIYTEAAKTSKLMRYAIPGEKVTITGYNEAWFSVRLYNGRTGFIERRHLKTVKVFYDESITTNYMDKRLNVELKELSERFNGTIRQSIYLGKYQIAPRLVMIDSAKRNNIITITMEYSAINNAGAIIPSRQSNDLQLQLQDFVELVFKKMLPSMADSYVIIVRKPVFSIRGQVLNTQGIYAQLTLSAKDIDPGQVKSRAEQDKRLLTAVESTVDLEDLFKEFPH